MTQLGQPIDADAPDRTVASVAPRSVAVLMYHAVAENAADRLGGAEANYTVTRQSLENHLRLIAAAGARAGSVAGHLAARQAPAVERVLLTFDDGHVSNAPAAALIARHGGAADFFINPSTVGQPDFLSWAALREMAAAGMSIQSHGMHHRYLDQATPAEVRSELADSKREIEDRLGTAVTLFAPPGGRQCAGLPALAQSLGYVALCSSRADYWQPQTATLEIPRLAVLSSTGEAQLDRWVRRDAAEMQWQRRRHRTLALAKSVLGNGSYDAVRGLLLRLAGR